MSPWSIPICGRNLRSRRPSAVGSTACRSPGPRGQRLSDGVRERLQPAGTRRCPDRRAGRGARCRLPISARQQRAKIRCAAALVLSSGLRHTESLASGQRTHCPCVSHGWYNDVGRTLWLVTGSFTMTDDRSADDADMDVFVERIGEGGIASTLFGNVFGYSIPWTPGAARWGYAVGYPFLSGALLGFAIAVAGSAWIVFTAPSRWERVKRTGRRLDELRQTRDDGPLHKRCRRDRGLRVAMTGRPT